MWPALVIALFLVHPPSQAQTYYKCQSQDGKVSYQNIPCAASGTATIGGGRLTANTVAPVTADRPQDVPQAAPEYRQQAQRPRNVCPTEQDIRNLETSATSISLGEKERQFYAAELRRARACSKEGGNYTDEDWQRVKDAQADQSRIDGRDRATARARAEATHATSASQRELERMMNDKRVEALERDRLGRQITSCDAKGCWDAGGRRYAGSGAVLFRVPDGARCGRVGTHVECD